MRVATTLYIIHYFILHVTQILGEVAEVIGQLLERLGKGTAGAT